MPTAVANGIREGSGGQRLDPICFLDWARSAHPPRFEELPWEAIPSDAFFYKWVPIVCESETRSFLFRSLPLVRRTDGEFGSRNR